MYKSMLSPKLYDASDRLCCPLCVRSGAVAYTYRCPRDTYTKVLWTYALQAFINEFCKP